MPLAPTDARRMTFALRQPETALAAIAALRDVPGRARLEGLVELIHQPPSARVTVAAIAALDGCNEPIVADARRVALESPHASVRIAAIQAHSGYESALVRLLRCDESWMVRRAALHVIANSPDRWQVLAAATDPHWRVRHSLVHLLLLWGNTESARQEIDERLSNSGTHPRMDGIRAYLRYRWSGRSELPSELLRPDDPTRRCPFWDWDVAVLARTLEQMGDTGRKQALASMPFLLGHADERVRNLAGETLDKWGEPAHFADVIALLDEPRSATREAVDRLVESPNLDRREDIAWYIFDLAKPSPAQLAWAINQVGVALVIDDVKSKLDELLQQAGDLPPLVRRSLARFAPVDFLHDPDAEVQLDALRGLNLSAADVDRAALSKLASSSLPALRAEAAVAAIRLNDKATLETLIADPDARVRVRLAEAMLFGDRLQNDAHSHVRAAALTAARAAELIADPSLETSWHVLGHAARLAKVPLWKLAPERWQPPPYSTVPASPLSVERPALSEPRTLGRGGSAVSALGVSGHYGLPVEGFVHAIEQGVNLLFWEPNYQTMTEFLTRLPTSDRNALNLITGTFEADGRRIERDVERVLRMTKREQITLFLLFWVQSWARVTPEVREMLDRLKAAGKIGSFGLSIHSRPLAVEAIQLGWNPVMVRHSLAHRGAETNIFPHACQHGTTVITFNNTCYGRLLLPHGDLLPPRPADCYRYTLAQAGVTACLSAPATLKELEENLLALREPGLSEEMQAALRAHGDKVYEEETTFRKLIRAL